MSKLNIPVGIVWLSKFFWIRTFIGDLQLGVSTGRVGPGLGSTRNRPDLVGWLDSGPAADREKSRVESDRARVDSNQIQLQPKDKNQRTNLKQIPQI